VIGSYDRPARCWCLLSRPMRDLWHCAASNGRR